MKDNFSQARAHLELIAGKHSIYTPRRQEYATNQKIPFRVAPTPFQLTGEQKREIGTLGADITSYFTSVDELYRTDVSVRNLLNSNKPEIFLGERTSQYLFVRPDLIITPAGFSICEIETSPFGLGLAEMLNRAYSQQGFSTMVAEDTLPTYVQANSPAEGTIIYTNKTASYAGQLTFLADEVFSGGARKWEAKNIYDTLRSERRNNGIYRGFYLGEYLTNPAVKILLEENINNSQGLLPSPTPHMEEKAVLSFLWDTRFIHRLRKQLGDAAFNHLREVIPPTWIVGQEQYFALGLPNGISTSVGLATLSRSKRTFVLKESGFGVKSSWAEGVVFLHEKSSHTASEVLYHAQTSKDSLFVVQQFKKAQNIQMQYETLEGDIITAPAARIRLTPYYSMADNPPGNLIGIKVTGCENTDFIHASSSSINSAVS